MTFKLTSCGQSVRSAKFDRPQQGQTCTEGSKPTNSLVNIMYYWELYRHYVLYMAVRDYKSNFKIYLLKVIWWRHLVQLLVKYLLRNRTIK